MSPRPRGAPFADKRPNVGVVVANQQRWGTAWQADESGWQGIDLAPGQTCNGFGMRYPRQFVAVYADAGQIWLQAGRTAWDLSTVDRVQQLHEGLKSAAYELQFADGSRAKVKLQMPPSVWAFRLIDPTYDEIDSLADDVMKTFPYVASDGWTGGGNMQGFMDHVLPLWTSGVSHGP